MTKRFEIKRMANIKTPNGAEAVFFEVWDVIGLQGAELVHRNQDRAFKNRS